MRNCSAVTMEKFMREHDFLDAPFLGFTILCNLCQSQIVSWICISFPMLIFLICKTKHTKRAEALPFLFRIALSALVSELLPSEKHSLILIE